MKAEVTMTTVAAPLAEGQVAGQYKITIAKTDGSESQTQMVNAVDVALTFDLPSPGDYIATASLVDLQGADIAPAVTHVFSVLGAQVPQLLSIQLQ